VWGGSKARTCAGRGPRCVEMNRWREYAAVISVPIPVIRRVQ